MINVALTKATLDALKAKLKEARVNLNNDGPAMKQVAVYLDQWVQKNFKSKGGNVGGWEPFKYGGRLTRKSKASAQSIDGKKWINGSAVLLQDTGAMRISYLPFVRKGIAGIGSELPYTKAHEEGDSAHNIPQRRILPKDEEVRPMIIQILDNFVLVSTRALR
jgi:phage gpG-like protein